MKWKKYAAVAACAALLTGVGVWGVVRRNEEEAWRNLVVNFNPYSTAPAIGEAIDIAPENPNGAEPGMKTIEGYETRETRAGVDVAVYHVLPYIEYGDVGTATQVALDWDIPRDATRRDLMTGEITSLLGGADAVDLHLDWSAYELTGWAACYEDGSFWGAYLYGYKGPMDHFEFAVTAGQMPPTCIMFGDSVEQEVWGMTITADKYDGENGCARRVSFMKDGFSYRFDLTATVDPEAAEKLVSRAVTYVAVGDGLNLALMTGGEAPAPAESRPVGNNDYESPPSPPSQDSASAPSVGPQPIDN